MVGNQLRYERTAPPRSAPATTCAPWPDVSVTDDPHDASYAVRGVIDLVLASTSSVAVAAGALVTYGVSTSTGMIAYQSTLQAEVPDRLRGRAFSLFDVMWNGARLVSLGLGGLIADAVGIRAVFVIGGVLLLGAATIGWGAPLQPVDPVTPAGRSGTRQGP